MTILLICVIAVLSALLVLVTLIQTFYMETLRLRTRELESLQFFREALEGRIGLKSENGARAFSITKHTLLIAISTLYLAAILHDDLLSAQALIEAFVFSWFSMLACAYVIPQLLYRHTSGRWVLPLTPVLHGLTILVRPLTAILGFLQSLAQLGEDEQSKEEEPTPAENIEALITAGKEEGILEEDDRQLIASVVAFGNKTVREVMTPRPSMVCIAADATLEDLRTLVIHEQFSRIPVYEDNIDLIIGFVHVRDMFEVDEDERTSRKVREVTRPVRLVPETKPVNDLLREMQQTGAHMAIVIDEYGNTAGLATMEDMVEEIVGEIRDEHEPTADVEQDGEGAFIVSGSFDVDHLQSLLEFHVQEDTESTTIGGLVTEWMGRVPHVGEVVERDGLRIEILAGNELRVEQVRISKSEPAHVETEADA